MTQVAALELAPRDIRVNAIAPGFVHTPLTEPATRIPGVLDDYLENAPRAGPARPRMSPRRWFSCARPRRPG
jgi:3-oxoacyl-[acyl-carrier protein] reductase